MAQKYKIRNYVSRKYEYFDTELEALDAIKQMEVDLLETQKNRFSVIQISESAQGTMWITPSENSQEDGDYMVFRSKFGTYEKVKGRTAAYAKNQELKDEFLAELAQTPKLVDMPQPTTIGTQEL